MPPFGDVSGSPSPSTSGGVACAIREDKSTKRRSVWCWGANDKGQLGTGATGTLNAVPVKVRRPADAVTTSPSSSSAQLPRRAFLLGGRPVAPRNLEWPDGDSDPFAFLGPLPSEMRGADGGESVIHRAVPIGSVPMMVTYDVYDGERLRSFDADGREVDSHCKLERRTGRYPNDSRVECKRRFGGGCLRKVAIRPNDRVREAAGRPAWAMATRAWRTAS